MSKNTMTIQIMDTKAGDKTLKYNPNNPTQVKKIAKEILDKIRLGYKLHGATVGKELSMVADFSILEKAPDKEAFIEQKMQELDRFIMNKELVRKVLTAPLGGG